MNFPAYYCSFTDVKAQRVSVVRFMDTMPDIHMVMFGSYYMDHLPEVMCDGSGSGGRASREAVEQTMRLVAVIAPRPVSLVVQAIASTRDLREEAQISNSRL